MPDSADILSGLRTIANSWQPIAVAWHVYFGLLLAGLLTQILKPGRLVALFLVLPLICVSVLASHAGNAFNAGVFAFLAGLLILAALRLPVRQIHYPPDRLVPGFLMIGFGWVYPHFLEAGPGWVYLYAAPTGLIPCPTLLMVTGLTLLADGFGSRLWSMILGGAGLFYGLYGALELGVSLDLVLAGGSLWLLLMAWRRKGLLTPSV